jgi:hypothetical protein
LRADIADVDHRKMVAIINRMAAVSAYAMENHEVGLAVMALAKKLQKTGLLPGKTHVQMGIAGCGGDGTRDTLREGDFDGDAGSIAHPDQRSSEQQAVMVSGQLCRPS